MPKTVTKKVANGDLEPDRLIDLRTALGWSQAQMAAALGLNHRSQVRHMESGRTRIRGAVAVLVCQLEDRVRSGKRVPPPEVTSE